MLFPVKLLLCIERNECINISPDHKKSVANNIYLWPIYFFAHISALCGRLWKFLQYFAVKTKLLTKIKIIVQMTVLFVAPSLSPFVSRAPANRDGMTYVQIPLRHTFHMYKCRLYIHIRIDLMQYVLVSMAY